jgi:hypothetical protein
LKKALRVIENPSVVSSVVEVEPSTGVVVHEDRVVFLVLFLIVHHDGQQHVDDLPHLIEFFAEPFDLLDYF